jgi:hypothetical protein
MSACKHPLVFSHVRAVHMCERTMIRICQNHVAVFGGRERNLRDPLS